MGTFSIVQIALFCSFAPIALVFFAIALGMKLSVFRKKDRCTEVVSGKVARYSAASYGNSAIHLPVVKYEIDDITYHKTGPKYILKTVSVSSPFINETTCEYTTDIYAQTFTVKTRRSSFVSIAKNPMAELFPIGSEIDVHYDPRKPERAYVLRLLENKLIINLFAILGVVFLAAACIAFII